MYNPKNLQQAVGNLLTLCHFNDGRKFLLDFSVLLYGLIAKQLNIDKFPVEHYTMVAQQIWYNDSRLSQLRYPFAAPFVGLDSHSMTEIRDLLILLQSNQTDIAKTIPFVFNSMLESMTQSRLIPDFITPASLADMMAQMLSPADGEHVLDPTCGSGRLLIASSSLNKTITLSGLDQDEAILAIAFFNLYFNGCTEVEFIHQDFFKYSHSDIFDVILSNPPYEDSVLSTREFVSHIVQTLKPGGRCGILVPEGFLTHTASREVIDARKWLLFEHSVQAVVSLPMKIYKPYTVSNSSLIIIKKEKSGPEHKVFFSRLPEFAGTDVELSDTVYVDDMQRIASAWKRYAAGDGNNSVINSGLCWTADLAAIQAKEYILASDGYRISEYVAPQKELEEIQRNIRKKQLELNGLLSDMFQKGG